MPRPVHPLVAHFSGPFVARCLGIGLSIYLASARIELDKTPYPCKDKYDEADVESWVAKHLSGIPRNREIPQMLLLLGGSGAGKGTFIDKWKSLPGAENQVHALKDFVFHGLDEYLPYIPEYQRTIENTEHVYKDAADACYGGAAIPAAKMAQKQIIAEKMDLIYEETGKNLKRIVENVLPPFIEARYRITVVLIHNDENIAIGRAAGRFQKTGRFAPDDYVRGTFRNNLATYEALKKSQSEEGGVAEKVYCDNSGANIHCWRDGSFAGVALVPDKILLEGPPLYMASQKKEL